MDNGVTLTTRVGRGRASRSLILDITDTGLEIVIGNCYVDITLSRQGDDRPVKMSVVTFENGACVNSTSVDLK
jgi:hypothetical protein